MMANLTLLIRLLRVSSNVVSVNPACMWSLWCTFMNLTDCDFVFSNAFITISIAIHCTCGNVKEGILNKLIVITQHIQLPIFVTSH